MLDLTRGKSKQSPRSHVDHRQTDEANPGSGAGGYPSGKAFEGWLKRSPRRLNNNNNNKQRITKNSNNNNNNNSNSNRNSNNKQ